jgi:hypothetical protein
VKELDPEPAPHTALVGAEWAPSLVLPPLGIHGTDRAAPFSATPIDDQANTREPLKSCSEVPK